MKHFETLSAFCAYLGLPQPEHPLFSVTVALDDGFLPCPKRSAIPISSDCFTISFKKLTRGELNYGRTKYDFTNGALFFISPRQVLQWDADVQMEQKGFSITFHEDFLQGSKLAHRIKQCSFFSYAVHEALHLSPREEKQIELLVNNMQMEYKANPDGFSKEILLSHLDILLTYAQRFYERQFQCRTPMSLDLLDRFVAQLASQFESGQFLEQGLPKIEEIASSLGVSQRYLSDTLKKETGKTTKEHIQMCLMREAKNSLLDPKLSIAEVAYSLGFEYPAYFSRLFKKNEGMSPRRFREIHSRM